LSGSVGSIVWQKSNNWTSDSPTWTTVTGTTSTLSSGALNANTAFRTILSSGTCSKDTSENYVVTVSPTAVAGTINVASSVCSGDSLLFTLTGYNGTAIQWQSSATVTGIYSNILNATDDSLKLYNLSSSSNKFYKAIVTSGVCAVKASSPVKTITIDQASASGQITGGGTICQGEGGTLILSGYTGVIQWQYSIDDVTYYNAPSLSNDTISLFNTTSTSSNLASYVVTGVQSDIYFRAKVLGGSCYESYSSPKRFVLKTSATIGTITGVNQLCVTGNTGTTLTLSNYEGAITWQKSTNWASASPTWTTVVGNSNTISTGVLTATTIAYRALISIGTCSNMSTEPYPITVYPTAVAGTAAVNDVSGLSVCKNGTKVLKVTGNIGSIQWQYSTSNGTTGPWIDVTGANVSPYSFTAINSNTFYRAKITSGVCPISVNTNALSITVSQPTISGVISGTDSICKGASNILSLSGSSGSIVWQKSTNWTTSTPTWSSMIGVNPTISTGALTASTAYRALLSSSPCPVSTTTNFVVNVSPTSVAGIVSVADASGLEVCKGGSKPLKVTGSVGTIQWQVSSNGGVSWTDIVGANSINYTIYNMLSPAVYRVKVSSGVCSSVNSNTLAITVSNPTAPGLLSSIDSAVCKGSGTTLSLSGTSGNITWQKTTTFVSNVPSSWVSVSSPSLTATYPTGSLTATTAYRAVITVGSCTAVNTSYRIIYVDPLAVAGTISLNSGTDLTVCEGGSKTLKIVNNLGVVKWQSMVTGTNIWNDVTDATTSPYTFTNIQGNTTYRAKVTRGVCPSVYSNTIAIIKKLPSQAGTITAPTSTVCQGSSTTLTLTSYIGSIVWQKSINWNTDSPSWTTVSGAVSATLNTGALSTSTAYRVIITNSPCSSVISSTPYVVNVSPTAIAGTINTVSSVCIGDSIQFVLTNYTGSSIQWQAAPTATGIFQGIPGATNDTFTRYNMQIGAYKAYRAIVTSGVCTVKATSPIKSIVVDPLSVPGSVNAVSYTHLRAHETG
jgi:hypothetical protein